MELKAAWLENVGCIKPDKRNLYDSLIQQREWNYYQIDSKEINFIIKGRAAESQ